jgi:hypothetical protein
MDTGQNVSTNCIETIQGVKQGCSLSPVVFNVYVDFMLMECKNEIPALEFRYRERGILARLCSLVIRY